MPLIQRFSTITNGAMVLTGNALSIRTQFQFPAEYPNDWQNGAYIADGFFIQEPGFPFGTTFNNNFSTSNAVLNMPAGSTVLYALLFWTLESTSPNVDGTITLAVPGAIGYGINPNPLMKQVDGVLGIAYQSQDVTTIVKNAGPGTYAVQQVSGPTIVDQFSDVPNAWYLLVVYRNDTLPYRYFNVNTGIISIQGPTPGEFTFPQLITPTAGTIKAYLLASESMGSLQNNSTLLIGPNPGNISPVGNTSIGAWDGIAPYAQINNILPGNILIADTNDPNIGRLDTRGSFGTYNKNPFAGNAPAFARVNTDILGINISSMLTVNQNSLFTRIAYNGMGSGVLTSQSVQVDLNYAQLSNITKTVDKSYANLGTTLTYAISMSNIGFTTATNVVLIDTIPNGTLFIAGSVNIDGMTSLNANPAPPGINLGSIAPVAMTTITFSVLVSPTIPYPTTLSNTSQVIYNVATSVTSANSNSVMTTISSAVLSASKYVNKANAFLGDVLTYTPLYK